MSHFYATIQGNRGPASRGGSKDSGINARIRGWDTEIHVVGFIDPDTGEDKFRISSTSGTSGRTLKKLIAEI